MEVLRSVCPYDCPDTCGLLVYAHDGKVVKVQGDHDHPFTRGTLCPKMAHYEKTVHSQRRILTPLLRNGAKGSDNFVPISWEEAIKCIKTNWNEFIRISF
jgi:Anaerobic dehydrogenases, typically selenocysteine-containing